MRIPALVILLSLFWCNTVPAADTESAVDQDGDRVVSWRRIVPNLWTDQKQIWLFPFRKTERNKWLPALVVGGITAGLIAADPPTARYFRNSTEFHSFNNALSGRGTEAAIIAAPMALYSAGLLKKDARTKSTAMLAGEAAVDAELVTIALKDITRRRGPGSVTYGQYSNSWLKSEGGYWKGSGSFPSGHTSTAFAVATVFADRYKRTHQWVPYVAYGCAALVGMSRITQSAHYMSDVFFGAALGYSISHFSVLRQ